jgi:multiple sugar transport system ATP-binding protein
MSKIDLVDIKKIYKERMNSSALKIDYSVKTNEKKTVFSIANLNLNIPDGKTTVILGPSGCGKTTLLKMIAGLEYPDSGTIYFDGADMTSSEPKDRKIGMVFQNFALYPHFSSKKNILSYYFFKKKTKEIDVEAEEKLKKTSELLGVEIGYLMDRSPAGLSGGEKQRVAIGRCITRDPSLFLMDEPFSSLDAKLREKYRVELKKLLRSFNITSVYVTHDQHEAFLLADIIVVMNEGRIIQAGTFDEIYDDPLDLFVADFINPGGDPVAINRIDGEFVSDKYKGLVIGVRPGDFGIVSEKTESSIKGKVVDIWEMPVKKQSVLDVQVGDAMIFVNDGLNTELKKNQDLYLVPEKFFLFDRISGKRIYKE